MRIKRSKTIAIVLFIVVVVSIVFDISLLDRVVLLLIELFRVINGLFVTVLNWINELLNGLSGIVK